MGQSAKIWILALILVVLLVTGVGFVQAKVVKQGTSGSKGSIAPAKGGKASVRGIDQNKIVGLPYEPLSIPTISVIHSPANPTVGQTVTVTATVNDPDGVYAIAIFLDPASGSENSFCFGYGATSASCSYQKAYTSAGTHTYYANATDITPQKNNGRDPVSGTKSFTVS